MIPNFIDEDQWGMEKCEVLHYDHIRRIARSAISASAEVVVVAQSKVCSTV